jgi:hypothetical protein
MTNKIYDNTINAEFDLDGFAKLLASSESRIVFIGIVDSLFKLRYSNFREGAKLYADLDVIRNLMTISARLVKDDLAKLEPILGKLSTALVRFEKRVLVFTPVDDYVIVVGLDTDVPTPFPEYVAGLIKTAAKRNRNTN